MNLIFTSSDMRASPLPSNESRRRSRTKTRFQNMFRFASPSQRLVNALSTGRRPRLDLRRSGYVKQITSLAGHFSPHSVDHVECHTSIFSFVGPHYILQTQSFTTIFGLQWILDGLCYATAKMHPSVLSWRICFKVCTLKRF